MGNIDAEMSGTITKILDQEGDSVEEGQDVIAMESMKMEMFVASDEDGKVEKIHVQEKDFVNEGDTLITLS